MKKNLVIIAGLFAFATTAGLAHADSLAEHKKLRRPEENVIASIATAGLTGRSSAMSLREANAVKALFVELAREGIAITSVDAFYAACASAVGVGAGLASAAAAVQAVDSLDQWH